MTEAPAAPRRIEYVPLSDVEVASRNPRSHLSLEKVIGSIRKYGFVEGAVHDGRTGQIIAGHGRKEALERMQLEGEPPPEGILEGPGGEWLMPLQYGWSSKNDEEAEALLVALNRLTETGGWETTGLAELLEELRASSPADFDLTGYESEDVDAMLAQLAQDAFETLAEPEDLDKVGPRGESADATCQLGDVWILGRHRLAVGDATDPGVVARALDGARAQMVFTDPPYAVAVVGQHGMTILNDDLTPEKLGKLLDPAFGIIKDVLVEGGAFYIFTSDKAEGEFRKCLERTGLQMRQQLVWVKDSLVLARQDYHYQHETMLYGWADGDDPEKPPPFDPEHETMLYGWKDGAAHSFEGGRAQTTVWLYPKPRSSDLHPTMKPMALTRRAIINSSKPGEERGRVLDPFAGSGTTLIACELSARSCSAVELDRGSADVICRRFQEHAGVVPVLERTGEERSFV